MPDYKLVTREHQQQNTVIEVNDIKIGAKKIIVMAGPCTVESKEQLSTIAKYVKKSGAGVLRGSAFKPRTSPYSFQGLGSKALEYIKEVGKKYNLITETEVMEINQIDLCGKYVDILRVGARNMHNFDLLKALGKSSKPIILKRGISATINEWLCAAEYIMLNGNPKVILCERGIRTFETMTRNTVDLAAVALVKKITHLPVIVDPSHGTGIRDLVSPIAKAAVAVGADGLLIEVHNDPENALCDGDQSLLPKQFEILMQEIKDFSLAVGRQI